MNIDLAAAPSPVQRFLTFLNEQLDELDAAELVEWLVRVFGRDPS